MFDLAIIGGGPAGAAAGVYASRKHLKTIFITKEWGGQSVVSPEIQNWIGDITLSGNDLAKKLKEHVLAYTDSFITVAENEYAIKIEKVESGFSVLTNKNTYGAKTVLVVAGAHRRKLEVPGAAEFDQKGLTYCASCDGPLFSGMDTAVIGGGNAAFETAAQLLAYARSVTILHHSSEFKADPVTINKILANPKMKALTNAETLEIKGDTFVTGLVYKDKLTQENHELAVSGVFVEIGLVPNSDFVKDIVKLDSYGRIVTDPRTQATSAVGIWAAGDITDSLYHQNNISAGDAIKAIEDIYVHLHVR